MVVATGGAVAEEDASDGDSIVVVREVLSAVVGVGFDRGLSRELSVEVVVLEAPWPLTVELTVESSGAILIF